MKKILISIVFFVSIASHATDGDLDPTFGNGGKVFTNITGLDDEALAIALQPDKKIIAAGFSTGSHNFALTRYTNDGSLDTTFGSGGIVITNFGEERNEARTVLVQKNGKIITAGHCGCPGAKSFALIRYNPDGTLDSSFGTGGKVRTPILGSNDEIFAAVLQSDGKLVAAGLAEPDFALARYNTDGSLDNSFGTAGIVTTDVSGGDDQINAVALQSDEKIVVAGFAADNFALARYNTDGSLDSSFGSAGIVTTTFSAGTDQANALIIQPDGKIVVAGFTGATSDFALARYNTDGSLDSSFGYAGIVTTTISAGTDQANAVVLQPDGKIVAVGFAGTTSDFALARYKTDGTLDKSFGIAGTVITSLSTTHSDQARAAAVEPNGSIITAGVTNQSPKDRFALVRYAIPSIEVSSLAQDLRAKYFLLQQPHPNHVFW